MSASADDRRSNATARSENGDKGRVDLGPHENETLNAVTMQERPSVDEWIIGLLKGKGAQTLDQLAHSLPGVNWAQFFLAVDRLNRSGQVLLWHRQRGDYLVSLKGNEPAANLMLAS